MPARTVVEVAELPMHALVQIEAVVSHGDGTPPQEVEARHGLIIEANDTDAAPVSPLSSQSVAFSHYNNISAQLGVDAASGLFLRREYMLPSAQSSWPRPCPCLDIIIAPKTRLVR